MCPAAAWPASKLCGLSYPDRLLVHEISGDEYAGDGRRVVNFNAGVAHLVDQHGLWLVAAEMDRADIGGGAKVAGLTRIGPPKYVDQVQINKDYDALFNPLNRLFTIVHELGHACRVTHHGAGDCTRALYDPGGEKFYVAVQQGQHSGVERCVMRYDCADYIEKLLSDTGDKYYPPYPPYERRVARFCRAGDDLGVNAPGPASKCGPATVGDCLHQLCISDVYH